MIPEDPPTFMVSVPHGYADTDAVVADLAAGGFRCVSVESISLEGHAASAAEVAAGYCMGTPLRGEIEARGDLDAVTALVAKEMGPARRRPGHRHDDGARGGAVPAT